MRAKGIPGAGRAGDRGAPRRSLLVLALLLTGTTSLLVGGALVVTALARSTGKAVGGGQLTAAAPVAPTSGSIARGDRAAIPRAGRAGAASRSRPAAGTPPSPPQILPGHVRVVIPAIGVDAAVVRLGLNLDGTLQVPTDFSQAGWWSGGPFPGDPGAAVVVGHVSSVAGPAVFARLGSLVAGDLVVVTRPDGGWVTFRVTRLLEVAKRAFPTRLVYGDVPGRQLRLVTCGGPFDTSTGHFVDNVIVFASLVAADPVRSPGAR